MLPALPGRHGRTSPGGNSGVRGDEAVVHLVAVASLPIHQGEPVGASTDPAGGAQGHPRVVHAGEMAPDAPHDPVVGRPRGGVTGHMLVRSPAGAG